MKLILYSKPGCHLCEGLEEKLRAIDDITIELQIRDITTNEIWWQEYQYEIPVLYIIKGEKGQLVPRVSPRISVMQLSKTLQNLS